MIIALWVAPSLCLWSQFCVKGAALDGQWGGARAGRGGGFHADSHRLRIPPLTCSDLDLHALEGQVSIEHLGWHLSFLLCVSLQCVLAGRGKFFLKHL